MHLVRDGLGGGPSGGEVPVAEGAERLAQALLRGIKSFVDQRPSTHPADLSSASIRRSKKILNTGVSQDIAGARRTRLGGDQDPDPAVVQRHEGVLIGEVVADEHAQYIGPVQVEGPQQPQDRAALIPVQSRPQLVDLLPTGLAQFRAVRPRRAPPPAPAARRAPPPGGSARPPRSVSPPRSRRRSH